jgi:hypothetical protein
VPVAEELTTPGPWLCAHREGDDRPWRTQVFDSSGETIATLAWYPVRRPDGNLTTAREGNGKLIAASPDLLALTRIIGSAYPNDPGTSDLDDSQPVGITLAVVRLAWAALAKVDR